MSIREIRFRGKSKYNNEFVYGYLIKTHTKNGSGYGIKENPYHINDNCVNIIPDEIIPETVGQFTGLKDKNGVKIFEGDILKEGNQIILVLWDNEYASFTLHCENWSCLGFFYEDLDVDKVEVIGNIHDNPEQFNIK